MSYDPIRDWLALVMISIVLFIGIVVWNIWAFDTVANGGSIGTAVVDAPPAFSRTSLNAVRDVFSERAAEKMKYETGVYSYAEPSQ